MGWHVGFGKEAPECVVWSESSFIESVLPVEKISHRHFCSACHIGASVLIVLGFASFFPLDSFSGKHPDSFLAKYSLSISLCLIFIGFAGVFTVGYLMKYVSILKLKGRSGLLFEPGGKSVFVAIEDALTYDKRKLSPDDTGLLFIGDEYLILEMEGYRAHLKKSEVRVSLLHASKKTAGVRLTIKHDYYPWSVTLNPFGNFGLFTEMSMLKKSNRLLETLVAGGVPSVEQADGVLAPVMAVVEDGGVDAEVPLQPAAASLAGTESVEDDITEKRYRDIAEILENKKKKKGWLKNIGILVISLLVFLQLGFFRWGFEAVLLILLVLIVHEMGHFIGMKMFGYKNVRMFFIPLLGAAVSGQTQNAASWKKAMVTLMGPLPGILISLGLFIGFLITENQLCFKMGSIFLFLNLLNLLPIFPLDGGRFLHEVLFSRNRYIELAVNILTAGGLLIAGFGLGSWFLKILGFVNLAGISMKFKMAKKSKELKKELLKDPVNAEYLSRNDEDVPEHIMKHIINWIHLNMKGTMNNKTVATFVLQMWERVKVDPPRVGATIGLLAIFAAGYVISFFSVGVLAVSMSKNDMVFTCEIVEYQKADGSMGYKEQECFFGKLYSESELSEDRQFYHGKYREYGDEERVTGEGLWDMGVHVGIWKYYGDDGELVREEHYEGGKPVLIKRIGEEGQWEEKPWDELLPERRDYYEDDAQIQHGPREKPGIDFES